MAAFICCVCRNKDPITKQTKSQEAYKMKTRVYGFRCCPVRDNGFLDTPIFHVERNLCPECLDNTIEKYKPLIPKGQEAIKGKTRKYKFMVLPMSDAMPAARSEHQWDRELPWLVVNETKGDGESKVISYSIPEPMQEILSKLEASLPKKREEE